MKTPEVILSVYGRDITGWRTATINRSIEDIAGTFELSADFIPAQNIPIKRQDGVRISIAGIDLIRGYALSAEPFYRRGDMGLKISGRDRSGDLTVAAAIHAKGEWLNTTIDRIFKDLLAPFEIPLVLESGVGAPIDSFTLDRGETVISALSRAARRRGLLVTGDGNGGGALTIAGRDKAPAAIARGQNVISMEAGGTHAQCGSMYIVQGHYHVEAAKTSRHGAKKQSTATAHDDTVARYLPIYISPDGNTDQIDVSRLAEHTLRVRRGHAYSLRYTVEGWLADGKTPWLPNRRVVINDDIALLDSAEWLITAVTQRVDLQDGAVTDLTVQPIETFDTTTLKGRGGKAANLRTVAVTGPQL